MKKQRKIKLVTIFIVVLLALLIAGCADTADTPEETQNEQPTAEPVEAAEQTSLDEEVTAEPEESEEPEVQTEEGTMTFSVEELSKYDGVNGNKAYVAYNGDVYDVTDVPQWKSGSHGGNMAGTDITEMLDAAPHGTSKLNGLEIVGKLSE